MKSHQVPLLLASALTACLTLLTACEKPRQAPVEEPVPPPQPPPPAPKDPPDKIDPTDPSQPTPVGTRVDFPGIWACDPSGIQDCPADLSCLARIPWSTRTGEGAGFDSLSIAWQSHIQAMGGGLCVKPCSKTTDCDEGRGEVCRIFAIEHVPYDAWLEEAQREGAVADFSIYFRAYGGGELHKNGPAVAGFCVGTGSNENEPSECLQCSRDEDCATGVCRDGAGEALQGDDIGYCHARCNSDSECSVGFACSVDGSGTSFCHPLFAGCQTCIDNDGDGYGVGTSCGIDGVTKIGFDCNDNDPDIHVVLSESNELMPPHPQHCPVDSFKFRDINCNGINDIVEMVGATGAYPTLHCEACGSECGRSDAGTCKVGDSGASFCHFPCADDMRECDGDESTFCETSIRTVDHCGECNTPCVKGPNVLSMECVSNEEEYSCRIGRCMPGYSDCDNDIKNGCEVHVASDDSNCGECGFSCGSEYATMHVAQWICAAGKCERDRTVMHGGGGADAAGCEKAVFGGASTYADCVPDTPEEPDYCETNILSDTRNCGGCGRSCDESSICHRGVCADSCDPMKFGNCDGLLSTGPEGCESSIVDAFYCGGCQNSLSSLRIRNSDCGKLVGLDCSSDTLPTYEDVLRLASVAQESPTSDRCEALPGGGFHCSGPLTVECDVSPTGHATRKFGCGGDTYTDDRMGEFISMLATSAGNCGGCGNSCENGSVCVRGLCRLTDVCPMGTMDCDGIEYNGCETPQDIDNCTGCGVGCEEIPNSWNARCVVDSGSGQGTCKYDCSSAPQRCGSASVAECSVENPRYQCQPCGEACENRSLAGDNERWVCLGDRCECTPIYSESLYADICDGRSVSCGLDENCPKIWKPNEGRLVAERYTVSELRPSSDDLSSVHSAPIAAATLVGAGAFTTGLRVLTINGILGFSNSHPRVVGIETITANALNFVPCDSNAAGCRVPSTGAFTSYRVVAEFEEVKRAGIPATVDMSTSDSKNVALRRGPGWARASIDLSTIDCAGEPPGVTVGDGYSGVLVGLKLRFDEMYPESGVSGDENGCVMSARSGAPCGEGHIECCVEGRGLNCRDTPKYDAAGGVDYREISTDGRLMKNDTNSSGCGAGYECKYRRTQNDYCTAIPNTELQAWGVSGIAPICSYVRLALKPYVERPTSRDDYEFEIFSHRGVSAFELPGAGSLGTSFSGGLKRHTRVVQYPSEEFFENHSGNIPVNRSSYRTGEVPRLALFTLWFDNRRYPHVELGASEYNNLSYNLTNAYADGQNAAKEHLRDVSQSLARDYVYLYPHSLYFASAPR